MSYQVFSAALLGIVLSAGSISAQGTANGDMSPLVLPDVPAAALPAAELVSPTTFRVCADPGNAPMSSKDGSGFENRIAELLAKSIDRPIEYFWFPQGMGFINRTLRAGHCDVVIGYAQGDEQVQNTNHYYSSAYVLVTRADSDLASVTTLEDPALQGHRVGVVAGTPPADHLNRAGLIRDAVPYPLMVDRRVVDPIGLALTDLKDGKTDAAVLWGPLAGPRIKDDPSLREVPLLNEPGMPKLVYRITMGVRPADQAFKRELNSQIRRQQGEIDAILREAGVPLVNDRGDALKPEE